MSLLTESTKREYEILREFMEALDTVKSKEKVPYEQRFIEEVRGDLINILRLHFDKNNLKQKYYYLREKQERREE